MAAVGVMLPSPPPPSKVNAAPSALAEALPVDAEGATSPAPQDLASRILAKHTAEAFRQSSKFPRANTSSCVALSASLSCRAAFSSIWFSRMNSSTSGDVLTVGAAVGAASEDEDVGQPEDNAVASLTRIRSKAMCSFATWMRPMRAALGFVQSVSSPRSITERCTSLGCDRKAAAARLSTSFVFKNTSTSAAVSPQPGAACSCRSASSGFCGCCCKGR